MLVTTQHISNVSCLYLLGSYQLFEESYIICVEEIFNIVHRVHSIQMNHSGYKTTFAKVKLEVNKYFRFAYLICCHYSEIRLK